MSFLGSLLTLCCSLIGCLPLKFRQLAGSFLGSLFAHLPTKDRTIAALQMQLALKSKYSTRTLSGVYRNLGISLFESLNLSPILKNADKLVETPDWPLALDVLSRGRPIICLTAHTGNWDLLAAFIVKKGIALVTIGRSANNPVFHQLLIKLRERYGIKMIWREDKSGLRDILKCLDSKQVVAALIDQDTDVTSEMIPFFFGPAKTPSALVAIGKKKSAIFVSAFLFRIANGKFCFEVRELNSQDSETEILSAFNRNLEEGIKRHPDQWVWFHKRWRTQLDGTKLSSKQYIAHLRQKLSLSV